ncbi:signal transduction histidine kinase [Mycetocola sp. CAN_C7]|uniref:sensor histidine kinase n=1 Tax=Mycetocola sp. CAN_C7 TaxID=2787724 RepID=UPI0018CB9B60
MFRRLTPVQVAIDLVVACVFALVVAGLELPASDGMSPVVVILGMTGALALRRLSPGLALAVAWITVAIQLGSGMQAVPSNMAIVCVLYATACYGGTWVKWAGLVSAIGGGVIAATYTTFTLYGGTSPFSIGSMPQVVFTSLVGSIAAIFVFGLSWTVGLLVRTSRAAREEGARRYQAQQERRLAEQAVVVEQERNKIARDMHDVVAHSLAVVIAQADGARYAYRGDADAMDGTLGTIAETARSALGDVRMLLAELRHRQGEGPQPLLTDLDALFDQMRGAGLRLELTRSGPEHPLPVGHQIAVYRILQEALTNALRHGAPDMPVLVDLAWRQGGLTVRVENVSAPAVTREPFGHGIPGMRERANLVGGALTAEATAAGGFVVTAFVPVPQPVSQGEFR